VSTHSNDAAPQGSRPPWFQLARFLLLAAFVVALYLLGQSMVRHRFFRGGRIDRYGNLRQN
jgi:hypothetical protein